MIPKASSNQKSISVHDKKRQAPQALQADRKNQTTVTIERYVLSDSYFVKNIRSRVGFYQNAVKEWKSGVVSMTEREMRDETN